MAKGKKQEDPNKVAQRKAERVAFVQSNPQLAPEVARQRFYVQTRANELEAAGKDVDRAALRAKFQSGGVTREGFYTPGDISRFNAARNTESLADSKATSTAPVDPVAPSATNVPTPVKPTTSSVKTPSTSYQAPQTTTALGQVVQPSTSYMGPQTKNPNPVRGGEPGRGVKPPSIVRPQGTPVPGGEPRPPVWESGEPVIGNITRPGQMYAAEKNDLREFKAATARVSPQAPANPKALRQQQQTRWQTVDVPRIQAQMRRDNPIYAARQAKIDAGFVEAPYDWTNLYRTAAGGAVIAAEVFGMRGGPVGGALAAGTAYNLTNRLGNLLEQKTGFGGVEGDPGFKGDTSAKGFAVVAGGSLAGYGIGALGAKAISKIPGIPSAIGKSWRAVQKWADDTPQVPATPWKESGVGSPGISTGIKPRTPWREGPITGGTKSPRRVGTPKVEVETPKPTKIDLPGETQTESGIIIPAPSTRARAGRTAAENQTLDEMSATNYNAFDEAFGKGATQEPVSLGGAKEAAAREVEQANLQAEADRVLAGGEKTYEQMNRWEKGAWTKQQKKLALQEQQVEVKAPTVPPAKAEPVPNVTPEPAVVNDPFFDDFELGDEIVDAPTPAPTKGLSVVEGNPRADMMRGHPSFGGESKPPALSVVKDEPIKATTKNPPRQRANETAEAYGKRLKRWQVENSDEVFKAPAGFEQPRGTISYREGVMERVQGGMSRTRRSVAFIDDGSGMSPEGYPVQMQGESFMAFNRRSAEFSKSRGIKLPEEPDNSFLAEGTPEPVSLAGSKEAAAAGEIPPKPKGLGRNAFYDAEKGEWVAGVLDKKSGKIVAKGERTVYATEEERIAGKKAYEAQRNAERRAQRAANRAAKETELKAAVTPVSSNAELGPFMFNGEPIGRSRVMLEPGQVPDWAQQNISLTGEAKPLSAVEDAWLNKDLTPEENAFFRELGNAKKASAGKRVVRSSRKPTPEEVKEYVARFRGLRGETGNAQGATNVAIDDAQARLEKEIEQVLGTDAMVALKNTAIRGNTPPLTQNIDVGLQSLAEVKATARTTGPLINYLDPTKPLPAATGRLREQAAQFFNAEGKLKGMTGKGRVRSWQRLTQSDWFRQLSVNEPSFANFLIEQNRELGEAFSEGVSQQVGQLAKPGLRRAKPMRAMGAQEEEKFIAGQLAAEKTDDGLGSYGLRFGDTPEEGLRARDSGLTVSQRSEAAQIEASSIRRERLLRQIKAEDQAAFGDIEYLNRGFERGQQLDPMVDSNVTKDYGIVDEKGFTKINAAEFRAARRELNSPYASASDSKTDEIGAAIEEKRKEVVARWRAKEITKEQMNAELLEFRTQLYDAPSTGLPSNPFAQEFGTQLPKDYVRETPESFSRVWDPDTWTNELGNKVNGRWVTREEAAEKAQRQATKQAENKLKVEEEWNRRHPAFGDTSWMADAETRAIAARKAKTDKVVEPIFRDPANPLKPLDTLRVREEARFAALADARAARIKAEVQSRTSMTAEQLRFEMKNPVFGPPKPWNYDAIREIEQQGIMRNWDKASMLDEESRVARDIQQEMFEDYDMDLGDFFGGIGRE